MQARMKNPAVIIPAAMQAIQALTAATGQGGVPRLTLGPVHDEIWDGAARHYDERGLAALIPMIATASACDRLNVSTRQVAGAWG